MRAFEQVLSAFLGRSGSTLAWRMVHGAWRVLDADPQRCSRASECSHTMIAPCGRRFAKDSCFGLSSVWLPWYLSRNDVQKQGLATKETCTRDAAC